MLGLDTQVLSLCHAIIFFCSFLGSDNLSYTNIEEKCSWLLLANVVYLYIVRTALADGSEGNQQKNEKSRVFFKKALDLYCLGTVYLGMKNEKKTKGNEMNYEDYMELLSEEIGQSLEIEAMEEAMSDIEEEYGSDTVENYMEYGV